MRVRGFIDTNVLDEAKKRIHHIYDQFDSVVVSFSGGKDSLAVLHLVKEVAEERGIEKVHASFYDEELIPDSVISFVEEYRQKPWLDLTWLAVQLRSQKYILGDTAYYAQWDVDREWLRPKPEHALTQTDVGLPENALLEQYHIERIIGARFPGRVAIVNGIRSTESLVRYRASLNKLYENYINKGATPKTAFCKPIFDWQENDVFRYFYDRGIAYCPIYDHQLWAGDGLRVSTPLHAESAKRFHLLAAEEPLFYQQIVDLFPEMLVQERYGRDVQKQPLPPGMGDSWDAIFRYIRETFTDRAQAALARKRVRGAQRRAETIDANAYPLEYVARAVFTGAYKREILPLDKAAQRQYMKETTS